MACRCDLNKEEEESSRSPCCGGAPQQQPQQPPPTTSSTTLPRRSHQGVSRSSTPHQHQAVPCSFTLYADPRTSDRSFRRDIRRLRAIALGVLMATGVLLIVTLLLHEAVLGKQVTPGPIAERLRGTPATLDVVDQEAVPSEVKVHHVRADSKVTTYSPSRSRGSTTSTTTTSTTTTLSPRTRKGQRKVMTSGVDLEESGSSNVASTINEESTTELPPTLPPALAMQRPMRPPQHGHYYSKRPGEGRRRKVYRKKPKPFKPPHYLGMGMADNFRFNDGFDPYAQGSHPYNDFSASSNEPGNIQDIFKLLTDGGSSNMMKNGIKFSGTFRNPKDEHGVIDAPKHQNYPFMSTPSPIDDYRTSGDPMEVNSGLLGFTSRPPRSNDIGKKPVSLMLDIYPMGKDNKKKPRKRPTMLGLGSKPPMIFSKPPAELEYFPSTLPFGPRGPPETIEFLPPLPMKDYVREPEPRPSFLHETRRPYEGPSKGNRNKERQQIRVQLNFYPHKRKNNSINGMYERMQKELFPQLRHSSVNGVRSINGFAHLGSASSLQPSVTDLQGAATQIGGPKSVVGQATSTQQFVLPSPSIPLNSNMRPTRPKPVLLGSKNSSQQENYPEGWRPSVGVQLPNLAVSTPVQNHRLPNSQHSALTGSGNQENYLIQDHQVMNSINQLDLQHNHINPQPQLLPFHPPNHMINNNYPRPMNPQQQRYPTLPQGSYQVTEVVQESQQVPTFAQPPNANYHNHAIPNKNQNWNNQGYVFELPSRIYRADDEVPEPRGAEDYGKLDVKKFKNKIKFRILAEKLVAENSKNTTVITTEE